MVNDHIPAIFYHCCAVLVDQECMAGYLRTCVKILPVEYGDISPCPITEGKD